MKTVLLVIVNLVFPWFLVGQATFQNTLTDQLGGINRIKGERPENRDRWEQRTGRVLCSRRNQGQVC